MSTPTLPTLWHEPAPPHFDLRVPCWLKSLLILLATAVAILFLDQPLAQWCGAHRIPDLAYQPKVVPTPSSASANGTLDSDPAHPAQNPPASTPLIKSRGDLARELMFLEQYGQFTCSVVVILAVALIDPKGRRRALSIAIACLLTVALTHLLKDLVGRSRPFVAPGSSDGHWLWGGPWWGFHKGSPWGSFPSAHTTAAFALASSLAWFYPRGRALFMTLATITATQRVCHTAHYLSDVVAGLGIGVFIARTTLAQKLPGRLIVLAPPNVRAWWLQDQP